MCRQSLDAGELLGVLNEPDVTGAWQEQDWYPSLLARGPLRTGYVAGPEVLR
jgi:hypothetical protein